MHPSMRQSLNKDRDRDRDINGYGYGHGHGSGEKEKERERLSRRDRIRDIEENNVKDLRRLSASRESVRQLTQKIDRAVNQLRGSNNYKLHERINEKLSKRLT